MRVRRLIFAAKQGKKNAEMKAMGSGLQKLRSQAKYAYNSTLSQVLWICAARSLYQLIAEAPCAGDSVHGALTCTVVQTFFALIIIRATHDARTEHSVPNKSVALSASACQVSKH